MISTATALLASCGIAGRIENAFKYLSAHHGIDALADYHADIDPDTTKITNPARVRPEASPGRGPGRPLDAERALANCWPPTQRTTR